MNKAIPISLYTATDIIEHALLHARRETLHCERCNDHGDISCAELDLALESRLVNARGLIGAVYDLGDPTALTRSLSTLDHLIEEALQLRTLSHRVHSKESLSLIQTHARPLPVYEACRSVANRPSGPQGGRGQSSRARRRLVDYPFR